MVEVGVGMGMVVVDRRTGVQKNEGVGYCGSVLLLPLDVVQCSMFDAHVVGMLRLASVMTLIVT